jgi:3-phenylpropionate/trans-cinnamate dioxygenase ferredoxin reductase component
MTRAIVIVGGGLAGQRFAETLRREGHDGPLRMVCAEPTPPYDRPPLSKELLAGERVPVSLRLRDDAWYRDQDVELHLGVRALALDTERRRVGLSDGTALRYGHVLIGTGATPVIPPVLQGYENVLTLRDLPDALLLADRLRGGARLVIVGAGFIGLEVASTARSLGADVVVVEAAPAPLAGPLGAEVGTWFARLHRRRGVTLHVGARVESVRGARAVRELRLADSTRLHADVVLAAVGATPDTGWLGDGTIPAAPGVFAAGDVTGHGHWESAARGGGDAARALLGRPPAPQRPAGFWSDQHGVRFQLVGDTAGADRIAVDGDPDACDFSVTYWRGDRPAAVLLADRPAELPGARRAIEQRSAA